MPCASLSDTRAMRTFQNYFSHFGSILTQTPALFWTQLFCIALENILENNVALHGNIAAIL